MAKPRLSGSERTKRRLEGLVDRNIFKNEIEAVDFAVDLLMKYQLHRESEVQAAEYKPDDIMMFLQMKTANGNR